MADTKAAAAPLAVMQPHGATNFTFIVLIAVDDVPQQIPLGFFAIPPGSSVGLAGRSKAGANVAVVRAALYLEELQAGLGRVVTPDNDIAFPVDSLGFWIVGKAGDGLVITVSGGSLS